MPNQMIALQARAPQTDVLGASIQRNAQMMNMMSQQRAAERQATQAAQQMEIARAQEARAAAGEERAAAKFAIDQDALLYAKYRNMAPAVIESNNPEVYANWLAQLNAELPDRAKMIADAMPPERFNKDAFTLMMATMDQRFEARYGKAITKELIAPGPTPDSPATVLGVNISGIPGATYAAPVPDISRPRSGATPPATSSAAPTGGLRPTRGVNTTPADLRAQMAPPAATAVTPERLDAAARAVARGASVTDPMLRDLSESDFLEVQKRASRLMQNSPELQTMSAGGAAQPDLGAIVQTMMDTGVVSQSNLEAMRAAAGPGKDAQLAEILRSNNIRIMPDEQPAGGMRSAVYRPEEGAAGMTQVQYNPNDYEQVRVKSPMQSPLPGSAQVPLGRVRAEAQAGRETPEEAAAKVRATERARTEADREKSLPAKRQVSAIVKKIRDAYDTLNKENAIPSSERGAGANIWDYLSVSTPGREIQRALGTKTSKQLTEITGSRKLLATAIKNATGMSAQEMNSNVELQLMLDALTDPTQGYEGAISLLTTIEDLYGAPKTSAPSPTKGGKRAVRTGVHKGRRVVEYSDGSVEYAD